MANDVYDTVDQCGSGACNRKHYRHKRSLQLSSASVPLIFVAMDILGPLPETTSGNQYVVVLTDCYSKLIQAIPTSKKASAHIANIFLDQLIILYGIPSFILMHNGSQLVSKFFGTSCAVLGVKNLATTAYYLQFHGHAKRFDKTVVTSFDTMSQNINSIGIDSFSHSPMRKIHRYTGPPTLRRTATVYPGNPQELQHFLPVALYRPTRMAKLLHEPCSNSSKNESKLYAHKPTLISVGHNGGINRITTVALAEYRHSARVTLPSSTAPVYRKQNPASQTISQQRLRMN